VVPGWISLPDKSALHLEYPMKMNNDSKPIHKTQSVSETAQSVQPWYRKLSIEEGGIERITDEERLQNTTKFWNAATFW